MANELIVKDGIKTSSITVGSVPLSELVGTEGQVLTIDGLGQAQFAALPSSTTFTMVNDHTELLAQTPIDGQITFVVDDNGLGEYGLYIYVDSTIGWKLISNQDSSATDSDSIGPVLFTDSSDIETLLFTTSPQTRVFSIIIDVIETFDGTDPSVLVGDAGDNARLVNTSDVDLSVIGTYEIRPTHVYSTATEINLYLDADGSAQGSFNIVLSYN